VLSVWDVFSRLRVNVFLGETEVYDVNGTGLLGGRSSEKEVLGLDVSVNKVFGMDILDAIQELNGDLDDRFGTKSSFAEIKEVFQGRTQEFHHKCIEFTAGTKVIYLWHPFNYNS